MLVRFIMTLLLSAILIACGVKGDPLPRADQAEMIEE